MTGYRVDFSTCWVKLQLMAKDLSSRVIGSVGIFQPIRVVGADLADDSKFASRVINLYPVGLVGQMQTIFKILLGQQPMDLVYVVSCTTAQEMTP